jgi:hypothetical protein
MMAGLAADGGVTAGFFTLKGTLSITLVANQSTPHAGEFNSGTLTVAPGARMSGADQTTGAMFTGDLSGQLDCGTGMFVGTISNGMWSFIAGVSVMLTGSLSATYDPNANPVALVNGSLDFASPQIQGAAGAGTWSATHQ